MIQAETLNLLEWPRLCQHLATFAATKLGARVAQDLRIPNTLVESEALLAQTREVYQLETTLPVSLSFEGIQDIGDALERAALQGILSGDDLLAIATTLSGARTLRRTIDQYPDLTTLNALVADLRTYPELEQDIHRCIDERGRVMDRASARLGGIREQLKQQRDRIYQILQGILQRHGNAVQEALITQRGDRFVLPVKSSHKDIIPGIVHDTSTSGATLYVEPNAIVSHGNQLRQLLKQERVEEEAVRRALSEQVADVHEDLERLLAIATTLDLATARARYSLWLGANPPRFVEFGSQESGASANGSVSVVAPITLRQLRHPLLIWQHQHEQGPAVVPIDLVIQPQIRVVAITGPNTGGKTVTLKTLGLAALMAKVGLFVPAREPVELPWFHQVLADIGDEQSLQQSLSTFSGHIRRIGRILAALQQDEAESDGGITPLSEDEPFPHAPTPSLVLLDEVGAGTDPSEGSALAIALLRYLADHAALTVATTHYGELKALKYQDERFENASVEFDDVTLSPTYRLLWGIPGRSNALAIAQRLGLNPAIVEAARAQIGAGSESDVNRVIAGLEQQRRQQEEKTQSAEQLIRETERLHQEILRRAETLRQRERELQQQQEEAVQAAIAQAKAEIARVIRQLQRGPETAQTAQQATEALNELAERHLPSRQAPPKPKPGFRPKVGDRVRIPRLGQVAEVLTHPDDSGEFTVRFGLMKMTVSLADVESLQGEKAELPAREQGSAAKGQSAEKKRPSEKSAEEKPPEAPAIRTSKNTLDLRGSRVADAEIELERAIASAQPGPLWIIHGHGTGKLRQGVHAFLKEHPQVSRFEAAEQADGGSGVTVAYVE
ncbi:endonuclease MutS2 [Thermoleptolyngbya sp. M55_K2018_002]|uniref:endonuclease MutS2 n=1 Tax=Thermoleptolyngbya sp. M55_K2018_002 TaxID=2747808 RepID=UPI001A054526|nr:endonuclease MutS2 [Thermoleptolyngbya sp. M55_K2018_002]HIK40469.1 endonuclease MutS2 [Thermoleptolyngbya sp. M55_K2018_002]